MPDSAELAWTVTACALIAHADGVLEGAECERLMAMIDEELADHDYADWLALVSDPARLHAQIEALPAPPRARHREVLERAWGMAMVDGESCAAEVAMLESLGARLGVEPVQLEFWREAWTAHAQEFAEWSARAAAKVLAGDAPVLASDRAGFLDLLERLPTTKPHREQLRALIAAAPASIDAIGRALAAMPAGPRRRLLRSVASLAVASAGGDAVVARFLALCEAGGASGPEAQACLERAWSAAKS